MNYNPDFIGAQDEGPLITNPSETKLTSFLYLDIHLSGKWSGGSYKAVSCLQVLTVLTLSQYMYIFMLRLLCPHRLLKNEKITVRHKIPPDCAVICEQGITNAITGKSLFFISTCYMTDLR